MQPTRSEKLAP